MYVVSGMATISAKKDHIELKKCSVSLRHDNIVEINIKPDLMITKENAEEMVQAMGIIGNGKKHPVLIVAGDYTLPESDARPYIASYEANKYTLANAFVINSMAQKLVGNVYLKIDRPVTPTKIFTDKTEAIKWLSKFAEQ